jgi:hypothetical protein
MSHQPNPIDEIDRHTFSFFSQRVEKIALDTWLILRHKVSLLKFELGYHNTNKSATWQSNSECLVPCTKRTEHCLWISAPQSLLDALPMTGSARGRAEHQSHPTNVSILQYVVASNGIGPTSPLADGG